MTNSKWIEVNYSKHTRLFPVSNITDIIKSQESEDKNVFHTVIVIVVDRTSPVIYRWRYREEIDACRLYEYIKEFLWNDDGRIIHTINESVYSVTASY